MVLAATLAVGFVLVAPSAARAATDTITVDGIKYLVDTANPAAGATPIYYDLDYGTDASIPAEISVENVPYPVLTIGEAAFSHKNLTSVEIPDSVTTIGRAAFAYNRLTSVEIPDSVTTINYGAFAENALTSVRIPNSVTTLGSDVFSANSLTSVEIPDSITAIGDYAFRDNSLESVEIPDTVMTIGDMAFLNNNLESLALPESVTDIGDSTFLGNNLTGAMTLPDSVVNIGAFAFSGNKLTGVDLPSSVTTIGKLAFQRNNLTSVTIPNSVTTINPGAFVQNNLESVSIPNSVTTIGTAAFGDNELESVTIPASVTSIDMSAFALNAPLTDVWFDGDAPTITAAGERGSFGEADGKTLHFLGGATGFTTPTWQGYDTQDATDIVTVTFDTGDAGSTIPEATVQHGDAVVAPAAPTRDGYTFTGWFTDTEATDPFDFETPVTTDLILYAGWNATTQTEVAFYPAADIAYGETVHIDVTVSATAASTAAPVGEVTLIIGGDEVETRPLNTDATAEFAVTADTIGEQEVTAQYSGHAGYGASTGQATYRIVQIRSTIELLIDVTATTHGDPLAVSALIGQAGPGTAPMDGDVQFVVDNENCGDPVNVNGITSIAALDITDLKPGKHTVQAVYHGTDARTSAESTIMTVTVTNADGPQSPDPKDDGNTVEEHDGTMVPPGATSGTDTTDALPSTGIDNGPLLGGLAIVLLLAGLAALSGSALVKRRHLRRRPD